MNKNLENGYFTVYKTIENNQEKKSIKPSKDI
jgi:hypothetical protein